MNLLSKLHLEGFRSIKNADIALRPLNVMIGANGVGKSNLIDFFRMLNFMMSKSFQDPYMRERGPASAILHFGPATTDKIRADLMFETAGGKNHYRFTLSDSVRDRLTFTKEEVEFHRPGARNMLTIQDADTKETEVRPLRPPTPVSLIQHPSDESGLAEFRAGQDSTAQFVKGYPLPLPDLPISRHEPEVPPARLRAGRRRSRPESGWGKSTWRPCC